MNLDLKVDTRSLQGIAQTFPKATASALNKVAQSARAEASRQIRQVYNIKKSDLDPSLRVEKATQANLLAKVIALGKRLALIRFGGKQSRRSGQVTVTIVKGQQKVLHAKPGQSKPFIVTFKSGHRGILARRFPSERKSTGAWSLNLPIEERKTISTAEMFGGRRIFPNLAEFVTRKLPDVLSHEIQYFLSRK